MTVGSEIHRRRSIRLEGYDYSLAGAYFVTVCTQDRLCLFGNVNNEQMTLNQAGQMVYEQWLDLPKRFPESAIDEFTVMPNHLHGILIINDNETTQSVGAPLVGAQNKTIQTRQYKQGRGTRPALHWVKLLVHSNPLPQTNISEVLDNTIGHRFPGN